MMKKYFFNIILLFLVGYKVSFSQTPNFNVKLSQTTTGNLLNFSKSNCSFSLNIEGKKIKPLPKNGEQNYLDVDGKLLQYLLVPFPQKMDYSKLNEKQKQDFLLDYEGYEMDYIKKSLNVNDLNEKIKYMTLNRTLFLFWIYDMPKQYQKNVQQQCYLITVCFDNMLVLNSPVEKDMAETYNFLTKTGSTLKMTSH